MPGLAILLILLPLHAWLEKHIRIPISHHRIRHDVPIIRRNNVNRKKVHHPRSIPAPSPRPTFHVDAHAIASRRTLIKRALHLHPQNRLRTILHAHVIRPNPAVRTRHLQPVTHSQHHEVHLSPSSPLPSPLDPRSHNLPVFHNHPHSLK